MFEDALIETIKRKQSKSKLAMLPVAIAAHALVLGVVVVAQLWAVDELPEPSIEVSFYQAPPPPPPPPPPPKAAPAAKTPPAPVVKAPETQPVAVPEEIPKQSSGSGAEGGVEGGIEGGEAGGVPGGVLGGVPAPTPVAEVDEPPIRVGGTVVAPERVVYVPPTYTDIARKARLQGMVIIEAIISKQGDVTDARILRGLPMGLSEAAIEAIRKWKYKPATLHGRPVAVYLTVTVQFTLQ